MKTAPEDVQRFRKIVRSKFARGVNEDVDHILDGLFVWLIHDAINGKITSVDQAARRARKWLCEAYPQEEKRVRQRS